MNPPQKKRRAWVAKAGQFGQAGLGIALGKGAEFCLETFQEARLANNRKTKRLLYAAGAIYGVTSAVTNATSIGTVVGIVPAPVVLAVPIVDSLATVGAERLIQFARNAQNPSEKRGTRAKIVVQDGVAAGSGLLMSKSAHVARRYYGQYRQARREGRMGAIPLCQTALAGVSCAAYMASRGATLSGWGGGRVLQAAEMVMKGSLALTGVPPLLAGKNREQPVH